MRFLKQQQQQGPQVQLQILTMVSSLLAEGGGHECEQGEPQRDEHAHVAQAVVTV